jgi:putative ABC transport system substrate-binding protein
LRIVLNRSKRTTARIYARGEKVKRFIAVALLGLVVISVGFTAATAPLKIGITKIVEHPALDAVEQGVIDALTAAGFVRDVDVEYLLASAQGDMATTVTIAQNFQAQNVDLVVAIATPSALSATEVFADSETPVIFAAVTAPAEYGLDGFDNVTGVSDLIDPKLDLELLLRIDPTIKTIGIVYNPGEANSAFLTDVTQQAAEVLGITIVTAAAENSSAVLQAAQSLTGRVDAIYATTDNTVASALEAVVDVAIDLQVPFLMADPTSIGKGATVCAGWDYYSHGLVVGDLVMQVLEGTDVSEVPITYQKDTVYNEREVLLNLDTAGLSGVVFPEVVVAEATSIYFGGVVWNRSGK